VSNRKPQRMCVGCRQMAAKTELFRVVKSPEGKISVDQNGKQPGRGAYLCKSGHCFNKALKSKALSRAFRAPIPDEILQSIEGLFCD